MHKEYSYKDIVATEVELSTHCSLKCPSCPRNINGKDKIPNLELRNISLNEFKQIYSVDLLKQLKVILLVGSFGDCIHNKELFDIIKWIRKNNNKLYLEIQTHGNAHSVKWWEKLASIIGNNSLVGFAIDGLADTYSIYRNGGSYEKVIQNAKTFINAGGNARWSFIVFKHNEHQLNECKQISKQLGFNSFLPKYSNRFFGVLDSDNIDKGLSKSPKIFTDVNNNKQVIEEPSSYVNEINYDMTVSDIKCNIIRNGNYSIYVTADGLVVPCGWVGGCPIHPNMNNDLQQIISISGGYKKCNALYTSIIDIVDGAFFNEIKKSWNKQSKNTISTCKSICGYDINTLSSTERFQIGYNPKT